MMIWEVIGYTLLSDEICEGPDKRGTPHGVWADVSDISYEEFDLNRGYPSTALNEYNNADNCRLKKWSMTVFAHSEYVLWNGFYCFCDKLKFHYMISAISK